MVMGMVGVMGTTTTTIIMMATITATAIMGMPITEVRTTEGPTMEAGGRAAGGSTRTPARSTAAGTWRAGMPTDSPVEACTAASEVDTAASATVAEATVAAIADV